MFDKLKRLLTRSHTPRDEYDAACSLILAAIESDNVAEARRLLETHSHLRDSDYGGGGWMHSAAYGGQLRMMEMLLELDCDVNFSDGIGDCSGTPIDNAIGNEDLEMMDLLLRNGARINPWHVISAVCGIENSRSLEMLKLLERWGADLHVIVLDRDDAPKNALKAAIEWRKQDVCEYLKSKGCVLPPSS